MAEVSITGKMLAEAHKKFHSAEKWICETCKGIFLSKRSLGTHGRTCGKPCDRDPMTHPIECDQCDKRFRTKIAYYVHRNVHRDKYQCDLCFKNCTNTASLKVHRMTHTGEKLMFCKHCKKGFLYRSTFLNHEANCQERMEKAKSAKRESEDPFPRSAQMRRFKYILSDLLSAPPLSKEEEGQKLIKELENEHTTIDDDENTTQLIAGAYRNVKRFYENLEELDEDDEMSSGSSQTTDEDDDS